ncbi:MAG: MetQ/NlpA family ABC transporter substrate-binding protein, partial [Methanosarcinales archaeon]
LGVMPDEATLPYYVADAEGIFADHGLNIEIVPFMSAMERDAALTAGELDAGENDPVGVLLLRNAGYDVKIVSLELQETGDKMRFAIIAGSQSNISSVADLEGREIAISSNTVIEYITDALRGDVQLQKLEVKKVPIRMQMLLDKEIDAATLPEPLASYALFQGANLVISDAMLNRTISQTVIVFSGDYIEKHPDSVDTFLDAYSEAVSRINANPENYRLLLVEKTRIPEEIAAEYKIATYLPPQQYPKDKYDKVLQWMQSKDLVQHEIAYEDVVFVR